MKKRKNSLIRETTGDKIFNAANILFLLLIVFLFIYPILYMVAASFSDPMEVVKGNVTVYPRKTTLDAYKWILDYKNVLNSYKNTIVYTCVGTTLNIIMTTLCAYPLSKKDLLGRKFITMAITFTMIFGGGMIPMYMVVRKLGMVNTMWALIIPYVIGTWNMFVMKNYFQTSIPSELMEAAYIDGCGEAATLVKIVLPLSKPILAVLLITYAGAHWNSYFTAKIYFTDYHKYPYQLVLSNLLAATTLDGNSMESGAETSSMVGLRMMLESMKYAGCVLAAVPFMVLFPLVQKHFEKGVMLGAIKG